MKRINLIKNNLLILVMVLHGQVCSGQVEQMSFNDFLLLVKKENPLASKAENYKAYANAQLNAAKGNYDPLLSSSIESKQFNASNYYTYGGVELKQPLYASHYLKMGYEYGQGIKLNPENSTPGAGLPYLGIEVNLLQGLWFDKRRGELIKSRFYLDFYDAERRIQLNDLLFVASNTYIDATYANKVNRIYDYFANLARQRLKGITELSAVGEKPVVDTIEASIFLQGRLLDQQASEIEKEKRLSEVLTLYPIEETSKSLIISDSLEHIYVSTVNTVQSMLLKEKNTNPVIEQYLAKQKILETETRLKREMIKPVLNLSYNFLSDSKTPIMTMNTNNYKWNATFSLPLYLRKPRNEYKMAELMTQNNEFETINKQRQLNYKRSYIIRAIEVAAGQISNAERSVTYSKLLVEAEKLKFMNGESSLFLLNTRENKWLETELKLAEYQLKFIKAVMELVYINGSLKYEM